MIGRFSTVVPLDGNNIKFRFEPVNIRQLQLFQVYVPYLGKEVRFHMQKEKDALEFKITDPDRLPELYLQLEPVLSDAIFLHCKEE